MYIHMSSALFWDYENVPLRKKDWNEFIFALDYIIDQLQFDFIRIYVRKNTISDRDLEILRDHGYIAENFRWVSRNDKNAVDHSMMHSCVDVMRTRPQISQILLITGDGDFKMLVNALPNHQIAVICQKHNYNQKLIDIVDDAISVSHFIKNPASLLDI